MARYLSLDWDHNRLHIVAAMVSGSNVKILRAVAHKEEKNPNPIEAKELGLLLKERLKSADIAPAPVLVCVGRDRLILKELKYPSIAPHEEPAIVKFQTTKELTDTPDEVVLDYVRIGPPTPEGEQKTMALVIRKELLEAYRVLCEAAGLKLAAVTARPLGSVATLQALAGGTPLTPAYDLAGSTALLTISEGWAEFCVFRAGNLLYVRSLPVSTKGALEIKRNITVYNSQNSAAPVQALYVAGIGEHGELWEKLVGTLETSVHALDPFGSAEGPDVPATGRGGFAGAVGLLHLWAKGKGELPINFVHPKKPKPPSNPNTLKMILSGGLAAALLLGLGLYGYQQIAIAKARVIELRKQKLALDQQVQSHDEDRKVLDAMDDWTRNEVIWLQELHDLSERFPDTTKARLIQMAGQPLGKNKDKAVAQMSLKLVTVEDKWVNDLVDEMAKQGTEKNRPYHFGGKSQDRTSGADRLRGFNQQFTVKFNLSEKTNDRFPKLLRPDNPVAKKANGSSPSGAASASSQAASKGGEK